MNTIKPGGWRIKVIGGVEGRGWRMFSSPEANKIAVDSLKLGDEAISVSASS